MALVVIYKPDGEAEVHWHSARLGEQPSRVTFELSPYPATEGSIVLLKITHDEFGADANIAMAAMGWTAILNNLKTLLETGKPLPYAWRG